MVHSLTRIGLFLAALFLAACADTPPDDREIAEGDGVGAEAGADTGKEPGLADIELCDAADYRPLIGTNIAATTLPADPMVRAFGENDIVTQDYRPHRTNIVYREGGEIYRVSCG